VRRGGPGRSGIGLASFRSDELELRLERAESLSGLNKSLSCQCDRQPDPLCSGRGSAAPLPRPPLGPAQLTITAGLGARSPRAAAAPSCDGPPRVQQPQAGPPAVSSHTDRLAAARWRAARALPVETRAAGPIDFRDFKAGWARAGHGQSRSLSQSRSR
jgi:hypothetical protein